MTNTDTIKLDLNNPNPTKGKTPHAIMGIVNDKHNYLLMGAVDNGIPYMEPQVDSAIKLLRDFGVTVSIE